MEEKKLVIAHKSIKTKALKLAWIILAVFTALVLIINVIGYANYSKKQEIAIEAMLLVNELSGGDRDFEGLNKDELLKKITFWYRGGSAFDSNLQYEIRSGFDEMLCEVLGYDEDYFNAGYFFSFSNFFEYYIFKPLCDVRYMPRFGGYNLSPDGEESYLNLVATPIIVIGLILLVITQMIHKKNKNDELYVEKDAVYYRRPPKDYVEIPIDRITKVKRAPYKSVAIFSPGTNIKISMIENQVEVINVITDLMNKLKNTPVAVGVESSYTQLTQLKELLDAGVITQEEFDAKKKQVLMGN